MEPSEYVVSNQNETVVKPRRERGDLKGPVVDQYFFD